MRKLLIALVFAAVTLAAGVGCRTTSNAGCSSCGQ